MKYYDIFNKNFNDCYIIAEIGVNHEGSVELAKHIIDQAIEGGANAVKFQTYKADKLASKNSPAYWDQTKESTKSQYELFKKYDKFGEKEYIELFDYCNTSGIEFLSTPFDTDSVKFLAPLLNSFKISSSDITNPILIEHILSYHKPIILSTGASYMHEVFNAIQWMKTSELDYPLTLLHCILNYPTKTNDAHLNRISYLKKLFPDFIIGYSDHTLPEEMDVCTTAYVLGAKVIEKHFTHDKKLPGNDHYHAMDKFDLIKLRKKIKFQKSIIGNQTLNPLESEKPARLNARRSLVASKPLTQGSTIKKDDLTVKRPATGIPSEYFNNVVGSIVQQTVEKDTIIRWDMIK